MRRPQFGAAGLDTDAQTFLTAISNSDPTIESAINQLVLDIKAISSGGVWTALKVIYPFVGGTSSAHAVNLKNPGTHNGTMNGTITHDANGVTGNGSTGYINTNFNQSTHGATNDEHVSVYSRTNAGDSSRLISVTNGSGGGTDLLPRTAANNFATFNQNVTTVDNLAVSDSLGYFSMNRTASTEYRKRQNTTTSTASVTSNVAILNLNFFLLARNNDGTAASFSSRNVAWAAIGRGLTLSEDASLRTAVETFQDALSRGVV